MDRPQKVEKQRHLRECLTAVCLHREKKNAYYFLRRCGVYFVITITSYTTYPLYSLLSETTFPLTPARSIRFCFFLLLFIANSYFTFTSVVFTLVYCFYFNGRYIEKNVNVLQNGHSESIANKRVPSNFGIRKF